MSQDQTRPTTSNILSDNFTPKRARKSKRINPLDEKGNADFNLASAEPTGLDVETLLTAAHAEAGTVDFEAMEKKRFTKPERAAAAVTAEDLAFEAELQRMHVESPLPASVDGVPVALTHDEGPRELLSEAMPETKPAVSLQELEHQVFQAKQIGCNAIEADEKVIRYFTRNSYPADTGYFMYKDIKVFIPGKFAGHPRTDRQSIHDKVFGNSKVK